MNVQHVYDFAASLASLTANVERSASRRENRPDNTCSVFLYDRHDTVIGGWVAAMESDRDAPGLVASLLNQRPGAYSAGVWKAGRCIHWSRRAWC